MSKSNPKRPKEKPRRDFPLFAHVNGQWAKKIKGKLHYFGRWADRDAALKLYLDTREDLQAGRAPRKPRDGLTVADLAHHFLNHKRMLVDSGAQRSPSRQPSPSRTRRPRAKTRPVPSTART